MNLVHAFVAVAENVFPTTWVVALVRPWQLFWVVQPVAELPEDFGVVRVPGVGVKEEEEEEEC